MQTPSREHFPDDMPLDISESIIAARVAVGQLFVIEAHEVQDCGVEVVNVDGLVLGAETDVVGGSVNDTRLHAGTGQPGTKCPSHGSLRQYL